MRKEGIVGFPEGFEVFGFGWARDVLRSV